MEQSTTEIDFLHLMSNKLVQAATPQQQLDAVSDYARLRGATQGVLFYIDNPEIDPVEWVIVSGEWMTNDKHHLGVGARFDTLQLSFVTNVIFTIPIRPLLVEDILERTDVDLPLREILIAHHVRGAAILPLHNNGRWIGVLWFSWDTPHTFTQQDAQIYTSILQQVAPIIDSHRLLEQRHQRAIELENAYQELDLLYRTGELINRANTYEELIEAVAPFDPRSDFVSLMLWETLDWETSDRLHVVFSLDRTGDGVLKTGDYVAKSDFPVMRLMLGSRLWDFDNTQTDPRTDERTRASWKAIKTISFYGIALYIDDRWLGGITYHSNRPRRYSDRQKRLLIGIGDMVLGAVERIRLKQETDASRQRAEILAQINAALLKANDEIDIMDAIASYAATLNIYGMNLVYIDVDPETHVRLWRPVTVWHAGESTLYDEERYPEVNHINLEISDLMTRLAYTALYIEDISRDPRLPEQSRQRLIERTRVRSLVAIPLMIGSSHYGVLRVTWAEARTFSALEYAVFNELAGILPFVIANRRNYLTERQRTAELESAYQELDILYRTGELINRANTYEEIMQAIAPFDPDADVVSLMLWENLDWEKATYLDVVAVIDRTGNSLIKIGDRLPKEDFPVATSMLQQKVWDFADTLHDSRADETTRASWQALGILSFFGTALYIGQRWLGGATFHSSTPRPFSDRQRRLLAGIGDMVLGAIERIRLKHESETSMQTTTVLEERNRLARELHDSVSQALYGIVLSMKTTQVQLEKAPDQIKSSLDYALSLSQAALSEMRALIFELRPETLEKEGLVDALNRQTEMIQVRYGVNVASQMCNEPQVPLEYKEHVYWIAREALHNIVKHARASQIEVTLRYDAASLTLNIWDNGIGFDPACDFTGHLGLHSMSERATRINAALAIASQPGKGTLVELHVPLG